jgi:hypothetical protein
VGSVSRPGCFGNRGLREAAVAGHADAHLVLPFACLASCRPRLHSNLGHPGGSLFYREGRRVDPVALPAGGLQEALVAGPAGAHPVPPFVCLASCQPRLHSNLGHPGRTSGHSTGWPRLLWQPGFTRGILPQGRAAGGWAARGPARQPAARPGAVSPDWRQAVGLLRVACYAPAACRKAASDRRTSGAARVPLPWPW